MIFDSSTFIRYTPFHKATAGVNVLTTVQQLIQDLLIKSSKSSATRGAKDVKLLNLDATSMDDDTLLNSISTHARSTVCFQVDRKSDAEPFHDALVRSLRGKPNEDSLVVCRVLGGNQDAIARLGKCLWEFIGAAGLVFVWQSGHDEDTEKLSSAVSPTDLVVELASSGLIPSSESSFGTLATSNYFNPNNKEFVAYFQKQAYSIRNPIPTDVDTLLAIDADSWKSELRYPRDILEAWVANKPQDIIVMVGKEDGDIVGAMYTQRVKDGDLIDTVPWRESIVLTAGTATDGKIDPNIATGHGKIKQLMRVSTPSAGGDVVKLQAVPGTALRDFALFVAASQGIDQVVSFGRETAPHTHSLLTICSPFPISPLLYHSQFAITRASQFVISDEMASPSSLFASQDECYESFLESVKSGRRTDRGLGFHVNGGAEICRKTIQDWIPEDTRNGGLGVLVSLS